MKQMAARYSCYELIINMLWNFFCPSLLFIYCECEVRKVLSIIPIPRLGDRMSHSSPFCVRNRSWEGQSNRNCVLSLLRGRTVLRFWSLCELPWALIFLLFGNHFHPQSANKIYSSVNIWARLSQIVFAQKDLATVLCLFPKQLKITTLTK